MKISYNKLWLFLLLCLCLCNCNMLDLSEVGYDDTGRLKASAVKDVLYHTSDGCWMTVVEGHEFYFCFHEDGTVILDSDFLAQEIVSHAKFSTNGMAVSLEIENCNVHFQNLSSGYTDTRFTISKLPSEGELPVISMYADVSGYTIDLQPTTSAYIAEQTAPKAEFNELFAEGLLDNQVISDVSGNFIGYYGLALNSVNDISVKVLTIENRSGNDPNGHTQYYESSLTKEGRMFRLDTPIENIKATNGQTYSFNAIDCSGSVVKIDGMPDVSLTSNANAVNDFDYVTSGGKFVLGKAQNHGAACDEIWEETDGQATSSGGMIADVNAMSYDYGWSGSATCRPLVIWTWWFANLAFVGSNEGASLLMNNVDKDWILFQNMSGMGETCGGGTLNSTEVAEINAYCKSLLDTWFSEKGLFVVRYDRQSVGDHFYIYLLCPDVEATDDGGMWMKFQRD